MVRLLIVQFDTPIEPWELASFRGAMALKAGWNHEHFHNHNNEAGGFHYRLPVHEDFDRFCHNQDKPELLFQPFAST